MKKDSAPITRDDLQEFANLITNRIVGQIREEMDYKLNALENRMGDRMDAMENRMKLYAEETAAKQNSDLLDAISLVIQPIQDDVRRHDIILSHLQKRLGAAPA